MNMSRFASMGSWTATIARRASIGTPLGASAATLNVEARRRGERVTSARGRARLALWALAVTILHLPNPAKASSSISTSSTSNSDPFGNDSDAATRPGAHGSFIWASSRSSRGGTVTAPTPPFLAVGGQGCSGYGSAGATEGTLVAFASATSFSAGSIRNLCSTNGTARAQWSDGLVVDAAGLTGQTGTLTASINLVGLFGADDGPSSPLDRPVADAVFRTLGTGLPAADTSQFHPLLTGVCAGWAYCGRAYFDPQNAFSATNLFGSTIAVSIPIRFGSTLPLGYTLDIVARGSASTLDVGGGGTSAASISDYGVGLNWGGISAVLDANGAPVSQYTATSLSGFDYRFPVVPEPSGSLLLASGLLWLVTLGSRTRRRSGRARPGMRFQGADCFSGQEGSVVEAEATAYES